MSLFPVIPNPSHLLFSVVVNKIYVLERLGLQKFVVLIGLVWWVEEAGKSVKIWLIIQVRTNMILR